MRFLGGVFVCALSILTGTLEQDVGSILSKPLFEQMLKHRNDAICPAKGLCTYEAFIKAAKSFRTFGTTGDIDTRKREIAAFLAQTSHETTGGWATAPDGPYAWGYCNPPDYYAHDLEASDSDPVISFETAFLFWMTPQSPKPSAHDVMTGRWTPSAADTAAGRVPGYGVVTNIIDGDSECGKGFNQEMEDRIGFYKRYCDILGVGYGNNVDCANQRPFAHI